MRCLVLLAFFATPLLAKDIPVADAGAWAQAAASAKPGDALVLKEGEWRDAQLAFHGQGTAAAPITIKAAVPGKTVLTGLSSLSFGGEHLVVEGLSFKDPDPAVGRLISFRTSSTKLARNCRLTNCAVVSTVKADPAKETHWVGVYGTQNRVDHCTFEGKTGKGTTFVVWLGEGSDGGHHIDHIYFGPREKLGENGGETIRVGDSRTSMLAGKCLVEENLFEKCNGEVECISNKSCGNIYRANTFLEVGGTLTLRHGNGCLVERNVFLGHGAKNTGGIRIIGEDHTVRGNYLEKLTGNGARAAICFMLGIPNSPPHRYFQVQRARVEDNTIVDCDHPLLIGLRDDEMATLAPTATVISGNQISSPRHAVIEASCALDGITWSNNHFAGKSLGIPSVAGIETQAPKIVPLKPIARSEVGASW